MKKLLVIVLSLALICALAIAAGISFVTVWRELHTPSTPAAQPPESAGPCADSNTSQEEEHEQGT